MASHLSLFVATVKMDRRSPMYETSKLKFNTSDSGARWETYLYKHHINITFNYQTFFGLDFIKLDIVGCYFMNQWMDFNETQKVIIKCPSTTNFCCDLHSRWPPSLGDLSKHKNKYNSVSFTDIDLNVVWVIFII